MDTLGIKDKVRSAGLSKHYKKDQADWSPKEKEIDDKIERNTILQRSHGKTETSLI
jgi:hypothetical protein